MDDLEAAAERFNDNWAGDGYRAVVTLASVEVTIDGTYPHVEWVYTVAELDALELAIGRAQERYLEGAGL